MIRSVGLPILIRETDHVLVDQSSSVADPRNVLSMIAEEAFRFSFLLLPGLFHGAVQHVDCDCRGCHLC